MLNKWVVFSMKIETYTLEFHGLMSVILANYL